MKVTPTVSLFWLVTLLSPTQARADPCSGPSPFADVSGAAGFCSDALWAKNANITTGCTGTLFCPGNPVTRAQMVLFLRRTALATYPANPHAESATLPAGDLDTTGLNSCTTTLPLNVGANASYAHVHAVVSMQAGASAADVQVSVGHSVSGGPFTPDHTTSQIVTIPAGQWGNASVIVNLVKLAAGSLNHFWRVNLARAPGSATTGELTALRCQLRVLTQMDFVAP
jgi:hypothetical protein